MLSGPLLKLASLGEGQWGLFTSRQAAVECRVTPLQLKRLTDRGHLVRILHGVYRVAGAPDSPLDSIRGAWLALEPARTAADRLRDPVPVGVVSHRSAAALQDLGDLDADIHQFTVARHRRSRSPDIAFLVAELDTDDWHLVNGLPATRPLRTVTDLASAHTDGGHLASVVRDAILTGDTTSAEIAEALRTYAHHYGVPPGDGAAAVSTFIHTAGVPASAVDLAGDRELTPEMQNAVKKTVLEVLTTSGLNPISTGTGIQPDLTLILIALQTLLSNSDQVAETGPTQLQEPR